ncbi:acid protease [Tilletiaria anomala UBC 951]|uniref:Acid protease n=1 Tax=Tilletiaria anomala (strain ATCC 24038 / CBS 436.72 / UBC 951) TaxID=1037660 RepID=A0A066VGN4_TILAU|nr:acid protease [Tilletiaria anomala UBC 951]KDN39458.1 acid protease [Tilletiaria anomala UBC 951]
MQLKAPILAAALATVSFVSAAPATTPAKTLEVPLSKRAGALLIPGSNLIDFTKVTQHMQALKAKYDKTANKNKRNTGTVPLTDQSSEELWTGTVNIGTPAQSLSVDFDTGSSDFVANNGAYNPSKSSTSTNTGNTFQVSYGDGTTASGPIYTDTATVGGLTATGVTIGRAGDNNFIGDGANALAGMGLPQLSNFPEQEPLWKSLSDQGKISPVFNIKLRTSGSTLILGAAGSSPTYTSLSSDVGYWQVAASVNGQNFQSVVDSGTTLIVAPTSAAKKLFSQLGLSTFTQDSTLYASYDCSSTPQVTFNYGSKSITLSSATATFGTTNSGSCVLSIVGEDIGYSAWITGDPLFRNTVVTFDYTNNRVGFS